MWDLAKQLSHWKLSVRNLSLCATVMFVATFLWSVVMPTPVFAEEANWTGDTLTYQGKSFSKMSDAAYSKPLKVDNPDLVPYSHQDTTAKTLGIIYVHKPADGKPLAEATIGQYVLFKDFNPPDTFSGRTDPVYLTLTKVIGTATSEATAGSSCDSSIFQGLGWILCPVSNVLASAVDNIYKIISTFLVVTTLTTDQTSSVYKVWKIIVGLANLCFIFAFLYIVYVHLTSVNVERYHLFKKSLPRLLIAAILVNVSYWICALGVDISNFLGYSVEQVFKGVRESVGLNVKVDWSAATSFILSAGTIGGFLGFAAATGGSFAAAGFLLISMLVSVVLAALVAFIILAARQALIVIFIIIAPFAFVAWVLPNTEKYFQKWFKAFMSLLMMFPIFSALFGGSMLAGAAIMNSANGSLIIALIGMAVQIVPLVMTPLIIRFSTGLLGQIANMTNNTKRGLADRTRNWAQDNAGYHKDKALGKDTVKPWRIAHRTARSLDSRKKVQQHRRKAYQQNAENRALAHKSYAEADEMVRDAQREHKRLESEHEIHWNVRMKTNVQSLEREMAMRQAEQMASLNKSQIDLAYENARAGSSSYGLSSERVREIQDTSETVALTSMAKSMADYQQRKQESDILIDQKLTSGTSTIDGKTLREYAGGVLDVDGEGENKALAYAVATRRSQFGKGVSEAAELYKHFNPSSEKLQDLVTGRKTEITGTDSNGRTHTFRRNDVYAMEAAIDKQVTIGTVGMVDEIIERSGSDLAEYRTTIADSLAKAGHASRSIYQGGSLINEISKGTIASKKDLDRYIQEQIAKGKASAVKLSNLDADAAKRFLEAAKEPNIITNPELAAKYSEALTKFKQSAHEAISDPQIKTNVADNAEPILKQISEL